MLSDVGMTVGSLFAGIGGFDLGLERAGFAVRWQVEIDPWCRAVLAKHWPGVERHGDVREVGRHNLSPVDVLCGGFPCQPHSVAGKRGASADRRDLWPEFARLVGELRPRYVVAENVRGLLSSEAGRFFGRVLGDLADCGYDAEWVCVPASRLGAHHDRPRVFTVAHRAWEPIHTLDDFERCECGDWWCPRCDEHAGECWCLTEGRCATDVVTEPWGEVTYPNGQRTQVPAPRIFPTECVPERDGRWATEPDVGRVAYGVPARVDRLRGLGNAIVPQIATWIGWRIRAAEGW